MRRLIFLPIAALVLLACNRVPSHVIQPEEMARLMADVRMADAVVVNNGREYHTDAARIALKQAVFERNGVTEAQFDTSLVWYGHNIERYQEVTNRSIEILEDRLKEASIKAAGESALSISGDSVDIWSGSHVYTFNRRTPSNYLKFSYDADQNWEKGDVYTFRTSFVVAPKAAQWNITAVYDDGAIETITMTPVAYETKRQEITLITDSTRTATHISGWLRIDTDLERPAVLDSVGLTRRRIMPGSSLSKSYQQKLILPKDWQENDTTRADETIPQRADTHTDAAPTAPSRSLDRIQPNPNAPRPTHAPAVRHHDAPVKRSEN